MTLPDLKPDAARAYVRLVIAAAELADEGQPTPCQRNPDAWLSEDRREREEAAEACRWCPVFELCRDYADMQGERWLTWAGADRTPQPRSKKEAAA